MNNKLFAQSMTIGGQTIEGPLKGIDSVGSLISKILQFLLPLAGVILLFVLIAGGYDFMMSQGNPEKIKSGRAKITAGIIGFVLLVISYLLVRVISSIFGLGNGLF